jgi:hypothetical protein
MNTKRFIIILLLLSEITFFQKLANGSEFNEETITQIQDSFNESYLTGPKNIDQYTRILFANADSSKLEALMKGPSKIVGLLALSELLNQRKSNSFDPTSNTFPSKYIEKSFKLSVPDEWSLAIAMFYYNSTSDLDKITDYFFKKGVKRVYKPNPQPSFARYFLKSHGIERIQSKFGLDIPKETELYENNNRVFVQSNNNTLQLAPELFPKIKDFHGENLCCTVSIGTKYSFLAVHANKAISYPLYCIDSTSGNIIWKVEIWANYPCIIYRQSSGPPSWHDIYFSVSDDLIGVFGNDGNQYCEAFSLKSGRSIFRFSTVAWNDASRNPNNQSFKYENPLLENSSSKSLKSKIDDLRSEYGNNN